MSNELKPCPFCGGEVKAVKISRYSRKHNVSCYNSECSVQPSIVSDDKQSAEREWNTRTPQQEWISVGDRLPELKLRVLAFDDDIGWVSARLCSAGWYLEGELDTYSEVTHWQPLPAPPAI